MRSASKDAGTYCCAITQENILSERKSDVRHLILYLEDSEEDEVFYELKDIVNIHFDFAKNIYKEAILRENNLKPLEILVVIDFKNGETKAYSAMKCEMVFN